MAGGAFSLVGAAAPAAPTAALSTAATQLVLPTTQTERGDDERQHRQADLEPVDPDLDVVDPAGLVKAVQRAEQEIAKATTQRAEAERRAARDCGVDESGLGAVKSHVRVAAELLGCRYGEPKMFGVAGRAGTSDHPAGKAIDFMVDRAAGDALAACALRNQDSLGITYVIWRQRINFGDGWNAMEDRGGITANHFDHVHVSFGSRAGGETLKGC